MLYIWGGGGGGFTHVVVFTVHDGTDSVVRLWPEKKIVTVIVL